MCITRLLCVIMYKNGREKMWQFILGSAGFLLYFIYDINSIKKKNTFFQKFFAWGTVLVALSLVMELWISWGQCQHRIGRIIGFGTGALCFLALLIYTLFFALPFEETYCEENKLQTKIKYIYILTKALRDKDLLAPFFFRNFKQNVKQERNDI